MQCCNSCNASIAFEVYDRSFLLFPVHKDVVAKIPTAHVEMINCFLEERIPGCTSVDCSRFEDDFEFSDMESLVDTVGMSDNFKKPVTRTKAYFSNVVRSSMGMPKRNTLKCNLITFENRNFVADRGCNVGHNDTVRDEIVESVVGSFFHSGRLAEVQIDQVGQNKVALSQWVDSRTGQAWKSLKTALGTFVYDRSSMLKYKLMVKADAKPKLDDTPLSSYVTGQNIVYHDRCVTSLFSHVFTQAVDRLKYVLADNVLLFHGSNLPDFAKEVSARVGPITAYWTYELDISKYDKSQSALMKDVEYKVLQALNVSGDVLDSFFCGEYDSVVTTISSDLILSVDSQRRSGGANTWLGNTVVLLALLKILLADRDVSLLLLSGDDSLIFSKEELTLDSMSLSNNYGFDVKLFEQCTPYFCSKYFVYVDDFLYFVPDPFKLLFKMGSKREKNLSLLHEVFMSFVDLTGDFMNENVVCELVRLDARRYGYSRHAYSAFCVIHILRANFNQFRRLYYDAD